MARIRWHAGAAVILIGIAGMGCSSSSDNNVLNSTPTILLLGETIPLGTTVTINVSGTYPLTSGTSALRTRCTGEVSVIVERTPGNPEVNTCQSSGSSSQLTPVGGLTQVVFELGTGASAEVTAN